MIKTIILYLLVLVAHLALIFTGLLPGKFTYMLYVDTFLVILFILGLLICLPGVAKGGESFTLRFLITTTVQLMLMLGLILVLTFGNLGEGTKIMGFSSISIFVILLAIQSVVLIKKVNSLTN